MDWALAIKRNGDLLKDIVLGLFLLAGVRPGRSLFILPRSTVATIMLVLRPVESALRRLILIAAYGLTIKPQKVCSAADIARLAALPSHLWEGVGGGGAQCAFQLFDPLKTLDPDSIWDAVPVYESGYDLQPAPFWSDASTDHTPIDATHLGRRLNALMRALNDIPRQARRLKRWEQKRDALLKAMKPTRLSPMRPGFPPGWRQRRVHEIDAVLKECHGLANDLLHTPDTS